MARRLPNVGLIGLGIIGSRVAAGLRAAGYPVFVWNRTPQPTPNFLGSPAEVAQLCRIIQLFVSDAAAVFAVIEAMAPALGPEHIVLCNATIGPQATLQAAKMVAATGAKFLDAPFTGSKLAAENKQLVYYIGGDPAAFSVVKPVLEATSKAIVPIGVVGEAAVVKVVTNLINAVSLQVLGEALALVRESGMDGNTLAAALAHNACRSGTMELKLPKMLAGDYELHFSLKHMSKDVQLGLEMARSLEVDVPATSLTGDLMNSALSQGWGDLDFASLYQLYQPVHAAPAEVSHAEEAHGETDPSAQPGAARPVVADAVSPAEVSPALIAAAATGEIALPEPVSGESPVQAPGEVLPESSPGAAPAEESMKASLDVPVTPGPLDRLKRLFR